MYTFTKLHDMHIPNVGVGVRVGPVEFQLKSVSVLGLSNYFITSSDRFPIPVRSAVKDTLKQIAQKVTQKVLTDYSHAVVYRRTYSFSPVHAIKTAQLT